MRSMRHLAFALAFLAALPGASGARAASDYPTEALADYVFACMAANGQTQEMLRRCSCSIDVIATIVPYDKYVQAQTILSMVQQPGEASSMFRDVPWMKNEVADLKRAQVEAEVRCF